MTTPARKLQPPTSTIPQSAKVPKSSQEGAPHDDNLAAGATALQTSTTVPLTTALSASTPGIKFNGSVSREDILKAAGIELQIRRSDNVIVVSILLMMLMIGLALSLLGMVFKSTSTDYIHLIDFWLASASKRSAWCPPCRSIWGLCLLP